MRKKVLVTGGAGFIGSHLTEFLVERGFAVAVLDNLSSGMVSNLSKVRARRDFRFLEGNCLRTGDVGRALSDVETVFHLAASPDVRASVRDPVECFRQNVYATHVLLEQMRRSIARRIVFVSSSTVYGDASLVPTPENYSPLEPISIYGASKLSAESLIASYCHLFDWQAVVIRLANVVGRRGRRGVVADFVKKLSKDKGQLVVLGDGNQTKSYLHIDDCVSGIIRAFDKAEGRVEVFNLGSDDQISVREIASIVLDVSGLSGTKLKFAGRPDGGGWKGDVKSMLLDSTRLKSLGWSPRMNSAEAIRLTAEELLSIQVRKRT